MALDQLAGHNAAKAGGKGGGGRPSGFGVVFCWRCRTFICMAARLLEDMYSRFGV